MVEKPETKIVRNILKWLKENGGDGYHVHGSLFQRSGEPDIDGSFYSTRLKRWLHLKIEVKTPTGKPTKLQEYRVLHYQQRGYVAGIVTNVDEVKELIYAYEDKALGTSG